MRLTEPPAQPTRTVAASLLTAVLAGALLTGCPGTATGSPVIAADPSVALVDEPVRIRVSGLAPGVEVVVSSRMTDEAEQGWGSSATFRSDRTGTVDLTRDSPTSGSYQGNDGMGLFWSMLPDGQDEDRFDAAPAVEPPTPPGGFTVALSVTVAGREVASSEVVRKWTGAEVDHRTVDLDTDGLVGDLFRPGDEVPADRPAVLLLSGSDGGVRNYDAVLLAAHGYPALALAYFAHPGLPPTLRDVPLEYLATAARLLATDLSNGPRPLVVIGYSRGAEAALLLAQWQPDLVQATVLYAPTDVVGGGFPDGGDAWTWQGDPIPPTRIPLDRITGPVLAIAGADDPVWPRQVLDGSAAAARRIVGDLATRARPGPHHALIYPEAGHGVGTFPHLPLPIRLQHPVTGQPVETGGTRAANEAARRDSWRHLLDFLRTVPGPQ